MSKTILQKLIKNSKILRDMWSNYYHSDNAGELMRDIKSLQEIKQNEMTPFAK